MITTSEALILGVVEGLTELLPVSSTGHLILVDHWLSGGAAGEAEQAARNNFNIVIQFGAIVAILFYYRRLLWETLRGLPAREPRAWRLAAALAIAFFPAAITGLLFEDAIDRHLFGVAPVIGALAAGGALMIGVELWRARRGSVGLSDLADVTPRRALVIGLCQVASLWPGTSRSMATIVGGQIAGLSTSTAAEFSFLLSLPTLGAATLYKLVKTGPAIVESSAGAAPLLLGLLVAGIVTWIVIGGFLAYLKRYGLIPFGVYRILLAGALALLWL